MEKPALFPLLFRAVLLALFWFPEDFVESFGEVLFFLFRDRLLAHAAICEMWGGWVRGAALQLPKKEWEYSLYKNGSAYELVIPLGTPAPGFDVKHILNDEEIAWYKSQGIAALQERLADMKSNYTNYKHQSWR